LTSFLFLFLRKTLLANIIDLISGVKMLLQLSESSENFGRFFSETWKSLKLNFKNFPNFLHWGNFYTWQSFSIILTIAKVSNLQYSRSCLLVSSASPWNVPFTIERKVLDAVFILL
jgi:hypothetical protein